MIMRADSTNSTVQQIHLLILVLNSQQPLADWSNHVLAVHEDSEGVLWVGTGGGLYRFNRATETFTWLRHDSADARTLGHNAVGSIYEGRAGSLWITTGGGLDCFDTEANAFVHYWHISNNEQGSPHWVLSIDEDREGILWLGTGGGVVKFDRQWSARKEGLMFLTRRRSDSLTMCTMS